MIGASMLALFGGEVDLMLRMPALTPWMGRARRGAPSISTFSAHRTTLHAANGQRECARRRRQIAATQLTPANGLVRR